MATTIEWTRGDDGTAGKTWNPVTGCSKVSPGCAHCYAERLAPKVFAGQTVVKTAGAIVFKNLDGTVATRPRVFEDVRCHEDRLDAPLHWRKPRRVFVNSMSDLFHEDVPFEFIDRVFAVMALCPQHTFQILTKRAERMREYMQSRAKSAEFWKRAVPEGYALEWNGHALVRFPLPNVWLGVSVENQRFADERIPLLLQTPAAIRFISAEPLLGPIDIAFWLSDWPKELSVEQVRHGGPYLDWVIVGGESGPKARPCDLAWVRAIVAQCKAAGVPPFVKQLGVKCLDGELATGAPGFGGTADGVIPVERVFRDKKGGDPDEWPPDLRVRQFPQAVPA